MTETTRSWSVREWWVLIALVMLAEYILLDLAYRYGGQEVMVSHVSFAASIASIVLAVIAIIYGFLQTMLQQSSSEKIATHIESLKGVVLDVRESKVSLDRDLKAITGIAGQLEDIAKDVSESRVKLSDVEGGVRKLQEQAKAQEQAKMNVVAPVDGREELSEKRISEVLLREPVLGLFSACYVLYRVNGTKTTDKVISYLIDVSLGDKEVTPDSPSVVGQAMWSGMQVTLKSLGLLLSFKLPVTVSSIFAEALDRKFRDFDAALQGWSEEHAGQLRDMKAALDKMKLDRVA